MGRQKISEFDRPWRTIGVVTVPRRRLPLKSLIRLVGSRRDRVPAELLQKTLSDFVFPPLERAQARFFEFWRLAPGSTLKKELKRLERIRRQPADYREFVAFTRQDRNDSGIPYRYRALHAAFPLDEGTGVLCVNYEYTGLELDRRIELRDETEPLGDRDVLLMTAPPEFQHLRLRASRS